jgi:hypothetical protein
MGAMPSGSYWRVLADSGRAVLGDRNVEADIRSSAASGCSRPKPVSRVAATNCRPSSTAMLLEARRKLGSNSCSPLRIDGLAVASQGFERARARHSKSPPRSRRQRVQAQSRAFHNGGRRLYGLEDKVLAGARNTICCRSVLLRKRSCAPTRTPHILSTLAPTL